MHEPTEFEPFDPSTMDEDAFLVGPDRHAAYLEGEVEQLLDVDDVFAKNLTTVLRDYSLDETDVWGRSPSAVAEGYEFAETEDGVLLLDPEERVVGAYLGCDLAVADEHQGRGLGAELVLEYAMRTGDLPTWELDVAAYSHAGEAAHRAAWRMACNRDLFERKAAAIRAGLTEADWNSTPLAAAVP